MIYLFAISGVASTKEKSFERLTNFIVEGIFVKKEASAPRAQRPNSERNLYGPPIKVLDDKDLCIKQRA